MHRSPNYLVSAEEIEAFVAGQRHGHLIAAAPDGFPSVSILPFVKTGDGIELHCVQADPTFAALQANPRVTFLVSDFLAFSPHDWVDPADAGRSTLHFRAVQYSCIATATTHPEAVAAALRRLVESYSPGGVYTPITEGDFYGPRLARLAALSLQVVAAEAKFKVGPVGPVAVKRGVVRGLRARGESGDARAADVIEDAIARLERDPAATPRPGG